jgi:peptidoglycan/LPS O-acetylase OafA/YrhL
MTSFRKRDSSVAAGRLAGGASQSIGSALDGHRNSLGIIRLVLATLVIFSHAFPTGGWGEDPSLAWTKGQETFGGFAVVGFFAVSGYLITKSGQRADIVQFMWRRSLRIFPAYWLALVVAAFVVGPIAWRLSGNGLSNYLSAFAGGPAGYVLQNGDLNVRQWGIYDIFAGTTPYGEQVHASVFNGSIWTLAYEWSAYLVVAMFVLLGVLGRARILVPVLTVGFVILWCVHLYRPDLIGAYAPVFVDRFRITLMLAFLYGACIALYANRIRYSHVLGVISGGIVIVTLIWGHWVLIGYPAFAYFILWLAAALPKRVQWIGAKNDYSYGMYVYGFLIQMFTAYLGWHKLGYWPWVALTVLLTAGCAWLSWHAVEKRAMALKDFGPGKGLAWLRPGRPAEVAPGVVADGLVPSRVDTNHSEESRS